MINNIGEKIKTLAICSMIIGCLFSCAGAIICWSDELFLIGFVILIGGCLISWYGSFVLYGFGELITQMTDIAKRIQNIQVLSAYQNSTQPGNITKEMIEEIEAEVINDYENQKKNVLTKKK